MKQRQETGAKTTQMKAPKKMDSNLSDQCKHDNHNINKLQQYEYNDYNTDESQDSHFNGEANLDEMEDLHIS